MNIELSPQQQTILNSVRSAKAQANLSRGDKISKHHSFKGRKSGAHQEQKKKSRQYRRKEGVLDARKVRSEGVIRKDLAEMLGIQMQAQLIRWGFV